MKQYCFDYIKESVDEWINTIPKTVENIEALLPFGLFIYSNPMKDPYGEDIEDFAEWYRQRHEYCTKLVEEYKDK